MPITVEMIEEGLYAARVTPPHGRNSSWTSPRPMRAGKLVAEWLELGCHQSDIGDAFVEANPDWLDDAS